MENRADSSERVSKLRLRFRGKTLPRRSVPRALYLRAHYACRIKRRVHSRKYVRSCAARKSGRNSELEIARYVYSTILYFASLSRKRLSQHQLHRCLHFISVNGEIPLFHVEILSKIIFKLSLESFYTDFLSFTEDFLMCRERDYITLEYETQSKLCIRYEKHFYVYNMV